MKCFSQLIKMQAINKGKSQLNRVRRPEDLSCFTKIAESKENKDLFFPDKISANERLSQLSQCKGMDFFITIALTPAFLPSKKQFSPFLQGTCKWFAYACRPQIAVLCWSQISPFFPGTITGSLFVLGQHFGGMCRNLERTLNNSKAGKQIGAVPTLRPLTLTAFLILFWSWKICLSPGWTSLLFASWSSLGFIWNLILESSFLVKDLFWLDLILISDCSGELCMPLALSFRDRAVSLELYWFIVWLACLGDSGYSVGTVLSSF